MYYVTFDKFNASLLNKSIIIIISFILLQISLYEYTISYWQQCDQSTIRFFMSKTF